jgi:hypothetical protein
MVRDAVRSGARIAVLAAVSSCRKIGREEISVIADSSFTERMSGPQLLGYSVVASFLAAAGFLFLRLCRIVEMTQHNLNSGLEKGNPLAPPYPG